MCGRFTQYLPWSEIRTLYRLTATDQARSTEARYNIAPTEDVLFVTAGDDGNHRLREGRWWLVPWWQNEMPKAAMFNVRSETIDTSGAFKEAFRSKRCLIPADGFYEWAANPSDCGKVPWHIFLSGPAPFSFAGLWAFNNNLGITSCTIVTSAAIPPLSHIHDRMPVILHPAVYDAWLDPSTPARDVKGLLNHHLDGGLQLHRVDRLTNSTNDRRGSATMIEPLIEPR